MKKFFKVITVQVMALMVLVGMSFMMPQTANAAIKVNEPQSVSQMLAGLNKYRASQGAAPVKISHAVTPIARDWTVHMADVTKMYHNPNYSKDARVPAGMMAASEIIAMNSYGTPDSFIQQWINSPPHEALMSSGLYEYVGIGIARNNSSNLWYATINFYSFNGNPDVGVTPPTTPPTTPPVKPVPPVKPAPPVPAKPVNVYTTPGYHVVNGREWHTTCEKYSPTVTRCTAKIKATQISLVKGKFVQKTAYVFNNLTYLPSPRAQWKGNPLATAGTWKSADGRQWKTSCGDSWTGPNGCRSFTMTTFYESYLDSKGQRQYRQKNDWVFNNIVSFSN